MKYSIKGIGKDTHERKREKKYSNGTKKMGNNINNEKTILIEIIKKKREKKKV